MKNTNNIEIFKWETSSKKKSL